MSDPCGPWRVCVEQDDRLSGTQESEKDRGAEKKMMMMMTTMMDLRVYGAKRKDVVGSVVEDDLLWTELIVRRKLFYNSVSSKVSKVGSRWYEIEYRVKVILLVTKVRI